MRTRHTVLAVVGGAVLGVLALGLTSCGAIDEQAQKVLEGRLGYTSVTVFPTAIRAIGREQPITYNTAAAAKAGQFIEEQKLATVTLADSEVPLTGGWGHNQAKMFSTSATELGAYVKAHPIGTEYAFMAEYLVGGNWVGGVHYYIVDANGVVATGRLSNSDWPVFKRINPQSLEDCDRLLIAMIEEALAELKESGHL
jgi:hypothetical protein